MTAEWVEAVATVLAFLAAGWAGVLSWKAYLTSFRPMLRIVPMAIHDDSGGTTPMFDRLVLKNLGQGPAISIFILVGRGATPDTLLGEVHALEPLGETYGPNHVESSRVGRVEVFFFDDPLRPGRDYRVLYVDISGRWHETTFKVLDSGQFEVRLAIPRHAAEVPRWVREKSQIVSDEES